MHTLIMLHQNSAVFSNLIITVSQQISDSSIQAKMTANCKRSHNFIASEKELFEKFKSLIECKQTQC